MARLKGSKQVVCGSGHPNFLKPGTERECSRKNCRRTVRVTKATKEKKR